MDSVVYDTIRAALAIVILLAAVYGIYLLGVEIVREGVISACK